MKRIRDIDAASYQRHPIHGPERCWGETNCYVDVIVELLHGLGFEPVAALPFSLCIDFEGDQWTFFKFSHADLSLLYGLDIEELNPWRNLAQHVEEQVSLGRPVLMEVDAFYLPDTRSTSYQREHVKTTIAINEIDVSAQRLGYFHGQSYYDLVGDDFSELFQLSGLVHERMLPPYIEYVKQRSAPEQHRAQLVAASYVALERHLQRMPARNPFEAFRVRYKQDLPWLLRQPIETFHQYSFATHRQYGACFELAETYLRWLADDDGAEALLEAADAFGEIAKTAKAYQFQLARAVARKRDVPLEPLDRMAVSWERGVRAVRCR